MSDASYVIPTVSEFKDYFARDFPFGPKVSDVTNNDISKAINQAYLWMNSDLFDSQELYTLGVLLLSAHFLVMNFRNLPGLKSQFNWLQTGKAVGNVSESFAIPDYILSNPILGLLSQTGYGAEFLMYVIPQLSGQIFSVFGGTNP